MTIDYNKLEQSTNNSNQLLHSEVQKIFINYCIAKYK